MGRDIVLRNSYIRDFRMNNYTIDQLYDGMTESFKVVITDKMMDSFREITGDVNPLHMSDDYAKEKNFDSKVVFGMLSSSFLSTLAGVYLPGKRSLIREVDVKMKKPVYVGDELTVSGQVCDIDAELNIFYIKVTITNQNGDKVLRGKMQMGIL